jgi:hypothetical protein
MGVEWWGATGVCHDNLEAVHAGLKNGNKIRIYLVLYERTQQRHQNTKSGGY